MHLSLILKRALVLCALSAGLSACGGGGAGSVAPSPRQPNVDPAPVTAPIAQPAVQSSSAPSAVVSSAPVAAANVSELSAANFTSIVNGQAWPASFRPYSALPWNTALPATPANVDATATASLKAFMSDTVDHIAASTANDYSHPVYLANAGDPLVTLDCADAIYGCNSAQAAGVSSLPAIHIPAQARPAGGTDAHIGVIQPDGTEYDFWGAHQPSGNWTNGATLSFGVGAVTSITGNGIPPFASATSGAALAAGQIRFDELARGSIPHAIFLDFPCTNGVRWPGTTAGVACAGAGVPMGALVYLNLSDAAIDALPASTIAPVLRPILHALHQYGGYAMDTYGGNGGAPFWEYESYTQYSAYGQTYPGTTFAQANGYTTYTNPTYPEYAGGPIRWSQLAPYMEVLSACYATAGC